MTTGGAWTESLTPEELDRLERAASAREAVAVLVGAAAQQARFEAIVVHLVEEGFLDAVASDAVPAAFATRLGGAPLDVVEHLAPSLFEAQRTARPVFDSQTVGTVASKAEQGGQEWRTVATTAAITEEGRVVGFVEVLGTSGDRPDDDAFRQYEVLAAAVATVIDRVNAARTS